jgi:hypothetical protein
MLVLSRLGSKPLVSRTGAIFEPSPSQKWLVA